MLKSRPIAQAASAIKISSRGFHPHPGTGDTRVATRVYSPYAARRQQHFFRSVATVIVLGSFATAWQWSRELHAEEPPAANEPQFEKPRKKASSKEENRDIISSQHLQVRRSWENPGVYAWGSNAGKVVAPDSNEPFIKTARRIPYFDGKVLRDVKLDKTYGAAIDDKGDLIQWGTQFSTEDYTPQVTLRHKDLVSLSLSRDRIIALSSNGTVYSIPASKSDQQAGSKCQESSWVPFWTSRASISYRKIEPSNLAWGEKISSVSSGIEHALLLTTKGRVYSFASASDTFPSRGQLGIPGLLFRTRPAGPADQPHEITTLRGFPITQISAGDHHSLAADRDGRVFAFGDNSFGQLGLDTSEPSFVDTPALVPLTRLYSGTSQVPRVTRIAAGGTNSYFTIDATRVASAADDESESRSARLAMGRVTADTWACGQGIWGALGNGRWTHVASTPVKIPSLSGLYEYDEAAKQAIPIRLARLSVGTNHVAAVMDNVTEVSAADSRYASENATNWGADILFFGNNEFYQLGTGKRNNVSNPVYIQPLDAVAERKVRGKEEHRFQITPKKKVSVNGRKVEMEQRVECGRHVTAVYSGV
ncbi:mitochondrial protein-like protein Fmp25 [Pseudovirgaria hyperparasitica]|uniref:Mitochondrial protein-like protein Fmp25 n=1 Tax=Pseudovirgaria hyperparasitica TaxID=470096 RepID=A0A6A6WGQ3_9PEZI|nr:mitochondrial protein-like protein Fmp25 [Pseudovirgaria hyperparasitica]KAF2760817.1 mitochondrial protein-like protein Fmp25 [Pseudovirgaria hyperparasitica]